MDSYIVFITFVFIAAITPGPNNTILMTTGITSGFSKTLPIIGGILCGIFLVTLLCATGVGTLLQYNPKIQIALKIFGTSFLCYFLFKIIQTLQKNTVGTSKQQSIGFLFAFNFQWINPKLWFMASSAAGLYLEQLPLGYQYISFSVLFCAVSLPCLLIWAFLGHSVQNYLIHPLYNRLFYTVILALALYAIYTIWI